MYDFLLKAVEIPAIDFNVFDKIPQKVLENTS